MLIGVAGPGRLLGFDWKRHTIFERSVEELQVSPRGRKPKPLRNRDDLRVL